MKVRGLFLLLAKVGTSCERRTGRRFAEVRLTDEPRRLAANYFGAGVGSIGSEALEVSTRADPTPRTIFVTQPELNIVERPDTFTKLSYGGERCVAIGGM